MFCGEFALMRRTWYDDMRVALQGDVGMLTDELVKTALKNVIDPEIGLDIVNLGLVYRVDILDDGKTVDLDMTLTTPACPAGPQIIEQVKREVGALGDVYKTLEDIRVNLVWSPMWSPAMMSEEARDQLGFF
jgi:metal-sulfur cluster biosynthetic enzyme